MELNATPTKLLVFLSPRITLGKTRSSPATGAAPPQLAPTVQLPLSRPPPVQTFTAPCPGRATNTVSSRIAKRGIERRAEEKDRRKVFMAGVSFWEDDGALG